MNQYKEKWRRNRWILASITCSYWENWWKGKHQIAAPTWMYCGSKGHFVFDGFWVNFFSSFELLSLVLLKVSRPLNSIYCSSLLLSPVSVSSVLLPAVSGVAPLFDNLHQQHPHLHLRPRWRESSQITKQCMCLVNDELFRMHVSTGPDFRALISNSACSHWSGATFRWPLPFPASLFKKNICSYM